MAFHGLVAFAHQSADRGRRGIEDSYPEAVDRLPEASEVGVIGNAVEHHAGRAVRERTIEHVTVAGDPTDVGGAPEDVVGSVIEHPVEGGCGPRRVAAYRVDD